jgi:hypothetical protein
MLSTVISNTLVWIWVKYWATDFWICWQGFCFTSCFAQRLHNIEVEKCIRITSKSFNLPKALWKLFLRLLHHIHTNHDSSQYLYQISWCRNGSTSFSGGAIYKEHVDYLDSYYPIIRYGKIMKLGRYIANFSCLPQTVSLSRDMVICYPIFRVSSVLHKSER